MSFTTFTATATPTRSVVPFDGPTVEPSASALETFVEFVRIDWLPVVVTVADVVGPVFVQENLAAEAPARAAEKVGDVRWRLPRDYAGVFVLFLQVVDEEGQVLAENAYVHSAAPDPAFRPLLTAPRTRVELRRAGEAVILHNLGEAFALGVRLSPASGYPPEVGHLRFGDNYLILPPGEERTIAVSGSADGVQVTGWNVESGMRHEG